MPWHSGPAHPPTHTHTHTHTLTDETPESRAKQKSTSHPLSLVSAVTCPSVRSPIGQPSCDPCSKGFWDLEFPRVKSSTGIYCTGSHVYSCVCVTYSLRIDYLSMRKQRGFSLKAWSILPIPPCLYHLIREGLEQLQDGLQAHVCVWERVTSSIPSLFNSTKLNDLAGQCEYRWDWRVRSGGLRAC